MFDLCYVRSFVSLTASPKPEGSRTCPPEKRPRPQPRPVRCSQGSAANTRNGGMSKGGWKLAREVNEFVHRGDRHPANTAQGEVGWPDYGGEYALWDSDKSLAICYERCIFVTTGCVSYAAHSAVVVADGNCTRGNCHRRSRYVCISLFDRSSTTRISLGRCTHGKGTNTKHRIVRFRCLSGKGRGVVRAPESHRRMKDVLTRFQLHFFRPTSTA